MLFLAWSLVFQGLDSQGQARDQVVKFCHNQGPMSMAKDNITGKSTSSLSPAHNLQVGLITIHNYVEWTSCARG